MSTSSCPWSDPALQTTRCRAVIDELKLNIDEPPTVIVEGLQSLAEGLQSISELVANQTAQIDTLKSRQAISGGLQAISLTILVLWIMMLAGKALCALCVKKVEQHEEEKHQEMIEMLESALAKRKAKRRATAKQVGDAPQ